MENKQSSDLKNFIKIIKTYENRFINNNLKLNITNIVNEFIPKLNNEDKEILVSLTIFLVDIISYKYDFKKTNEYYNQWLQNQNRDIKGVILLLLPFIDDKEKEFGLILHNLIDLNQLLYYPLQKKLHKDVFKISRKSALSTYFKFGNMGLGLINKNQFHLFDLYDENEKMIYKIMYHNLLGLLYSLEIMNGKYYINWINIRPINIATYKNNNLYINTRKFLFTSSNSLNYINIMKAITDNNLLLYYSGLWIGDIYNIIRIKMYEEIKSLKWLLFPYEIRDSNSQDKQIYLIHGLNIMLDLNFILKNDYYNNLNLEKQIIFYNKVKNIIINFKQQISVIGKFSIDIEIIKYYLIYVINNTHNINNILFKKFLLQFEDELFDNELLDNDFDKMNIELINEIQLIDIILGLEYLLDNNLDILWDFLKNQLDKLSYTIYGKYLINKETKTIINQYNLKLLSSNLEVNINLKNIYNVAKSLSHDSIVNWILLDKNYMSLSTDSRNNFFRKLCDQLPNNEWINLQGNLAKQNINKTYNYNILLSNILTNFRDIFLDLIFEELICSGILSEFVPNKNITDNTLLPSNSQMKKKKKKV